MVNIAIPIRALKTDLFQELFYNTGLEFMASKVFEVKRISFYNFGGDQK